MLVLRDEFLAHHGVMAVNGIFVTVYFGKVIAVNIFFHRWCTTAFWYMIRNTLADKSNAFVSIGDKKMAFSDNAG